jgi:hypothetical protein
VLTGYEAERAATLSAHFGSEATKRTDVRRYRQKLLGGELLTDKQAREVITSPAAGLLLAEHFEDGSIPLVGHTAEITEEEVWREGNQQHHRVVVSVRPPRESIPREWSYDVKVRPRRQMLHTLSYLPEDRCIDSVKVLRRSVLDTLRRLCSTLAARFPWQEAEAVRFVLTGEYPKVSPLTGQVRDGTITLTIASYVSAGTVRALYRQLQHQVGGSAQQETAKSAAIVRFVLEQTGGMNPVGRWPELQERWNVAYPTWQYTGRGGLRKAYHRAYRRIIGS